MRLVVWLKTFLGSDRNFSAQHPQGRRSAEKIWALTPITSAFMDQHFVHSDLEEQRRHEAKELQHEADQQDFAQQLAVFDQGGDEPAKVELGQLARKGGAAGDEDEIAGPVAGEDVDGFYRGPAGAAVAAGKLGSEPKFSRLNADPAGASLRCAEKLRSDPDLPTDPDLPDPDLPKSWNSTRLPSHWARMTTRIESSAPRIRASAGKGVNARRSMLVRLSLALRPRCLAARSRSSGSHASVGDRPIWCASVAGSAAVWCRRAIEHKADKDDTEEDTFETPS